VKTYNFSQNGISLITKLCSWWYPYACWWHVFHVRDLPRFY